MGLAEGCAGPSSVTGILQISNACLYPNEKELEKGLLK